MDLDSDTLYMSSLAGGGAEDGIGNHRSFMSYSRDKSGLDKYSSLNLNDKYCSNRAEKYLYGSSSLTNKAEPLTTTTNTTTTTTTTSLYRPSILAPITTTSSSGFTNYSSASYLQRPFTASTTTSTTNPHYSSSLNDSGALDKLVSSSSAFGAGALHQRDLLRDPIATTTSSQSFLHNSSLLMSGVGSGSLGHLPAAVSVTKQQQQQQIQPRVQSSLGQSHNLLQQLFDDMRQIEDTVDSIEIPARGRCKVFMAKYGYDPFKQSPNDNPDAELAFNAGDYIMVFDDIDEDGYFIGELMDGRRGYVPSNWLDRLTGEDLFEFQATTLYKQATGKNATALAGGTGDDELDSNSYPPEFYDALVSDTMNHSNFQHLLAPEDYHRMNDYVDLDDVNEVDDECLSDYERAEAEQMRRAVPPPQRLVLERQLNKCILIAWLHPQSAKGTIVSYQVYVDGVLKSTVPSADRTKALLEGVDSNIPHRISVRAIDVNGRHSNDAGCTIVIGQKIPFAPSCVKASHITSDSALISWLPCNSNFHHVVAVNSVEVQTVRPGVYKHLINGLSANTLYRVWVRAKPGKILSVDEKNPKKLESLTTYVDFKTMPKSLPDPPVNVQVEAGPQRRTLLVTWLPLTLNDFGSSNGCAVTGYAVFAGHKKLADIDSPTGDHALLDVADLESLHKKSVTVRTKSGENLSQDSMPCHIPDEYLKAASKTDLGQQHQQQVVAHRHHQAPGSGGFHHHRLSETNLAHSGGNHSPSSRQRALSRDHHQGQARHLQQRAIASGRFPFGRGRQMTRSLQNLESDIESRRSSIPAIEITRETSGSDLINQTESYSEEEFESSMRFRGGMHRGKSLATGGGRTNARYRTRQSHSVDGSAAGMLAHHAHSQHHQQQQANLMNRPYQSQASLAASNRLRGTPSDIRYFVALFDYDPSTMSPNPNAASDELAFKEGSIIKVYGGLGEDGFYKGELDNQIGYVPSNVITEITDVNLLNQLYEKNSQQIQNLGASQNQQQQQHHHHQRPTLQSSLQQQQQQLDPSQSQLQTQGGVKRMVALYDYDPQENSPNADTESEIPFKVGDVIYVYGKMDTDGFYMGEVERTKQRGLVPSNFLREDPLPIKMQHQQPVFNQVGANHMVNQMDPFQQQRPATTNQFVGNVPVPQQQQQPQQQQPIDRNAGNQSFVPNAQMQQQQQQQMGKQQQLSQNQMRGNIRSALAAQQSNPIMGHDQNVQQNNINRPTTLSLGGQQGAQMMNQQQMVAMGMQAGGLQQPQQQAGVAPQQHLQSNSFSMMNPQQLGGGQFSMGNNLVASHQPASVLAQQQVGGQQVQQPQQQGGGGVLSNLLSSGKQIIGAATTPRAPNQPGQFPSQMTATTANQMMNMAGGIDGGAQFQQNRANMMRVSNPPMAAFNPDPNQSQMIGHNSFQMMGNSGQNQQQINQQAYNQMGGVNRVGPATMNQMGEEQGGNILNTVKNMFKL